MKLRLLALSLVAVIATALAQNPPQPPQTPPPNNPGNNQRVNDAENRISFWDCTVPGGNFTIALSKISSGQHP